MRRDHPLLLGGLVTLLCASAWVWADPPPAWWSDTTNGTAIINSSATPNNYGVLNLGQLKYTASQAGNYLNQYFSAVGGAGSNVTALVANFTANTSTNFAPATIGQLEYVAKPFYDRLNFLGFNTKASLEANGYTDAFWTNDTTPPYYPWHTIPPGPGQTGYNATTYNNWLNQRLDLANLGQLKMAFSFDLSTYHAANNNLLGFYVWAGSFGLNITDANLSNESNSTLGDNVTYWTKFVAGENPTEYIYAANIAANLALTVTQGSPQSGNAGSTLSQSIIAHLAKNVSGTISNVTGAPIHYVVLPGDGHVSISGVNSTSGTLVTDSNGNISMNYTMGNTSATQWIHFTAPSTNLFADASFFLTQNGSGSSGSSGNITQGVGNYAANGTYLGTGSLAGIQVDPFTNGAVPYNLQLQFDPDDVTSVSLGWASAGYNANITYQLERKVGIDGTWEALDSFAGNVFDPTFTANDTIPYGGYRYFYQVEAYNGSTLIGTSNAVAYNVPLIQSIDFRCAEWFYDEGDAAFAWYAPPDYYDWDADVSDDWVDGGWNHYYPPELGDVDARFNNAFWGYPYYFGYSVDEYRLSYLPTDVNTTVNWYVGFIPWEYDEGAYIIGPSNMTITTATSNITIGGNVTDSLTLDSTDSTLNPDLNFGEDGTAFAMLEPFPTVFDAYGPVSQAELGGTIQFGGGVLSPLFIPNLNEQTYYFLTDYPYDHVIVSWNGTDAGALQLWGTHSDDGTFGPLANGEEIDDRQYDFSVPDGVNYTENTIYAYAPSAVEGDTFNITVDYYAVGNLSLGSKTFTIQKAVSPGAFSSANEEVAGAEYRKVALNGRPLPDGKPQTASESDQQDEETFVDALTLGLRHSVSDVYEKIPGTDLPLTVNRVYNEETWSSRRGLRPHERPDEPFGPGWQSNLVASLRWESASNSPYPNIYASDENGNEYHFLGVWNATGNFCTFVPYPTGKHEKNPYLATLAMTSALSGNETIANATLTLTKKFGTTVTYEHADLDGVYSNIPMDRVLPGSGAFSYSYFRATTATGLAGVGNLTYAYAANDTLVPETITGTGGNDTTAAGNMTIYIQQDENGLVRKVWDSDQDLTQYNYTKTADPVGSGNFYELTSVTDAMNVTSNYTYNITTEDDSTPGPSGDPGGDFYHLNLSQIKDQNANTYHFNYQYSYTGNLSDSHPIGFVSFNNYGNYYFTPGRPLMVANISLTNGNTTIPLGQFENDSYIEVGFGNTGALLNSGWRRHTVVTDADGHVTDYNWSNPSVMLQDVPSVIAAESPGSVDELVAWGNLTLTYKDGNTTLGNESYEFDSAAGMALMSATDFSGHTTTFTHADSWNVPAAYVHTLPGVYDTSSNGFFGYFDDPTSQTRTVTINGTATNITKTFTYVYNTRQMSDIMDENGHATHYDFDGFDNRLTEIHADGEYSYFEDSYSNVTSETDYAYGNTTFPGVVTDKTVRDVNFSSYYTDYPDDPGWVQDMEVSYDLDSLGRVSAQHVDPSGLNLTTSYTYSTGGDKLSETDPNGHITYFNYDHRHRLTSVIYPDNSTRSYTYDGRGNVLTETDELGHETTKTYDPLNRVLSVTRVMDGTNEISSLGNLTTSYTYSNTGARLSVTDPNGGNATYSYDGLNRLTELTTPSVGIGFNATGGNATSSTALHTYYYYNGTNPGGNAFDSSSFKPTSTVDPRGYTTTVAYDERYLPVAQSVQFATSGNKYAVSKKSYDPVGNLLSVSVSADGSGTIGSLGGNVETTSYEYDALNRLTQTTFTDNTTVSTAYTSTGFAYQSTDELGRVSQKQFDAAGRLVAATSPDPVTGAITSNSSVTQTQYDANGNAVQVIDPLGHVSEFVYDERNRKIASIAPEVEDWSTSANGTFVSPTVLTAYDAAGNPTSVTDARGNTTVTLYDDANRPTYTFTPTVSYMAANGTMISGHHLVTGRAYDQNGNVLSVHQGTASSAAASSATFDRISANNTYDALNRLLTTTDAAGIIVKNFYDEAGNRVALVDGLSHANTFTYDGLDRLLTTVYPGSLTTTFTYNALNKLSRTDALGHITNYTYDSRNRQTGVSYTGSLQSINLWGVTSYGTEGRALHYDNAGELIAVAENYANNSTVSNVAYAYDGLGRMLAENEGAVFNGTFSANTFGSLLGNLSSNLSNGFTNTYTYDAASNRLTATYGYGRSDAHTLTSTYDNLNRLDTLVDGADRQTTYRYDAAGNRVRLIQGNSAYIDTTFDALGRQTEIKNDTPNGNSTLYDYDLAYDEFANLKEQDEAYPQGQLGNRTVKLAYDSDNRLTSEALAVGTTTYTSNYTYDNGFNRTNKLVAQTISNTTTTLANITYTYRSDNALTSYHDSVTSLTTNISVDSNGNPYEIGTDYGFHYDAENRLVAIGQSTNGNVTDYSANLPASANDSSRNYAYDYRSRRVSSTYYAYSPDTGNSQLFSFSGGESVRRYVSANFTNVWSESYASSAFTLQNEYVRGSDWGGGVGGVLYAVNPEFVSGSNPPTAKYYHYDGRGDVVAQTADTGQLVSQSAYNAFGEHEAAGQGLAPRAWGAEEWTQSPATPAAVDWQGVNQGDLFANTKSEDAPGIINEGMRDFLMGADRFLTKDPAGFIDGPNLYAYVRQNPWTCFDAQGLFLGTPLTMGEWFGAFGSGAAQGAGEYAVGLAESPYTIGKGVVSGYQQIGDLAGDALTGNTGIGAIVQNPGTALKAAGGAALDTMKQVGQSFTTPKGIATNVGGFVLLGGAGADVDAPADAPPDAPGAASPKPSAQPPPDVPATTAPAGTESLGPAPVTDTPPAPAADPSVGVSNPVADAPASPTPPGGLTTNSPASPTQLELDFGQSLPWERGESGLVIGRGSALDQPGALNPGEFTLRNWFDVDPMEANLQVNLGKLQDIMDLGLSIRDASDMDDTGGAYLNAERGLLDSSGWNQDPGQWTPPTN